MAERTITVPIDPIDRGIDRHDTDIRSGKVTEALNVINDDGDLRRRDAYKTIYTAAPHFLPDGLTAVQAGTGPASDTLTTFYMLGVMSSLTVLTYLLLRIQQRLQMKLKSKRIIITEQRGPLSSCLLIQQDSESSMLTVINIILHL